MTETTKRIFDQYQVRKSKKQKAAFAAYVRDVCAEQGYSFTQEAGSFGANNLIVGNPRQAKLLLTAHYDTCARLPFPNFITPKSFSLYLLYQILISVLLLLPSAVILFGVPAILTLAGVETSLAVSIGGFCAYVALLAVLLLMVAGPANRHTANDNTSGVALLLDIMHTLPGELRDEVAFIFFDLEEVGLFGSAGYRAKHKKETKTQLLLNFDCISDGDHLLFALRKGAVPYADAIRRAFPTTQTHTVDVASRGVFYPSDQMNFPCGVGVAALKKSRRLGVLYMDRIHTKHDVVYCESNVSYLCEGVIRLVQDLANNTDTKQ
jgi:hypothetical protein